MDPYTAGSPRPTVDAAALRARIPGWGADLDPADRPSVPRERFDPEAVGRERLTSPPQPAGAGRERSMEHERLTPVYGTTLPLHGVSGAVRRLAYARFSEARAAHWLLLIAGDRVESAGDAFRRRPLMTVAPWLAGAAVLVLLGSRRRSRSR